MLTFLYSKIKIWQFSLCLYILSLVYMLVHLLNNRLHHHPKLIAKFICHAYHGLFSLCLWLRCVFSRLWLLFTSLLDVWLFFLSFRHWCKTIDLNWSLEGNNFNKELRAQHLNFFFFGHWICNNKSLRQLNLTWNCIQLDAKWYWFLMKFGNFGNEMCVWVGWIPGYLRIATQKVHGNVY